MMKRARQLLIPLSFLLLGMAPQSAEPPPIPLSVADGFWRPLSECGDPALQWRLERAVRKNRFWKSLTDQEKMAVGVIDLTDPHAPRFAEINGGTMMYAASLPKVGILLAAQVCFEEGSLKETEPICDDLVAMIRISDNSAATRMIRRIGLKRIGDIMMDPRYLFYDKDQGGGIWVGRAYASGGENRPDPIKGFCHAATVTQVCRFYYLLATGRLISPERSSQMLEALSMPGIPTKFVDALGRIAPTAQLYRKSGSWKIWHSDSTLVWDGLWRRYILVSMVEHPRGDSILRELVPVVDGILKPKGTVLAASPATRTSFPRR